MTSESPKMSRRKFLYVVGAAVAAAAVGGIGYYLGTRRAAGPTAPMPEKVKLYFTGWTYDVAKVQQNIAIFEWWTAQRPDIPDVKIEYAHTAFGGFAEWMAARFMAGTPVDVTYSSDHWLAKWADAEWIVPIDKYKPEIRDYLQYFDPLGKEALVYKDGMYGLPYYSDIMVLVHNFKMCEAAGVEVPETWEDLTDAALKIKQKGICEYPIQLTLKATPWLEEVMFAMTYSRGGKFFDENLEPIFGPGTELYESVKWIYDALHKHKILSPATLESTVLEAKEGMKSGEHAFSILAGYYMGEINAFGISRTAGQCDVAFMPGKTHETVGWVRFYAMGKSAVDRGVVDVAYKFIEFLGGRTDVYEEGKYEWVVAKRWAVENLLGFAILPLWEDEDVKKAFSKAMNVEVYKNQRQKAHLKQGIFEPWYADWLPTFRKEIQDAVAGRKSIEDALDTAANEWRRLKKEHGG